jgi:hypothetical protein
MARGQLLEAQEKAIKCAGKFKDKGDAVLKTFRDILMNEIIPKIKNQTHSEALERQLMEIEKKINEKVTK